VRLLALAILDFVAGPIDMKSMSLVNGRSTVMRTCLALT
jgi:hypothetical protein